MLYRIWFENEGLNQEISDWNLRQVISVIFEGIRVVLTVSLWFESEQLSSYLIVYRRLFEVRVSKLLHGTWFEIEGLNQEIAYWNLAQVISRVFQGTENSFQGGFMAWFWTIIQLIFRLPAFFLELWYQNVICNLIRNWRIESRDILLKLGTGYLKAILRNINSF